MRLQCQGMRAFAYESHALSCYRAGSLVELFIEENKKRGCGCWAAAATADAGKLEVLKTVEAACLPAATVSAATADFWRLEFRTAEGACELAAAAAAAANAVGCGSCVCLCFVAVARLEQAQVPLT